MRTLCICLFTLLMVISSCKNGQKSEAAAPQNTSDDILKQVAMASGYDHWNEVKELRFTFNVDRDTSHFERSWIWKPGEKEVTYMSEEDTVTYNQQEMDSTLRKIDASFINDKFWFLVPYQLMWDQKSFTYDVEPGTPSPIQGTPMKKLTIVYGDDGGYTPGDAYDLYLDDNNMIREWTFRRGNKPAPGSNASWEGYKSFDGLQLATMHQMGGGAKLYFTGIAVNP